MKQISDTVVMYRAEPMEKLENILGDCLEKAVETDKTIILKHNSRFYIVDCDSIIDEIIMGQK